MTASVSVAPTVAQNLFTISMSFDCLLSLAPFGASLHLQWLSILYCSWQIWFSILAFVRTVAPAPKKSRYFRVRR